MSAPYVKVYRYRIRPNAGERCLELWRRARAVYERHVPMGAVHLRSLDDQGLWLEIVTFPDEGSYRRAKGSLDAEPELQGLWREFEASLAEPPSRRRRLQRC